MNVSARCAFNEKTILLRLPYINKKFVNLIKRQLR